MQLLFKKSRSPSGDRARLCALRKLVKNNNNIKQSIEKIPRGFCEFSVAAKEEARRAHKMNEDCRGNGYGPVLELQGPGSFR